MQRRSPKGRTTRRREKGLAAATLAGLALAIALIVPTSGSARSQDAPSNTTEPQVSGSAVEGQTLTTSTGTWTGNPTTFAFQWLHCPQDGGKADGSNCDPIASATSSLLLLQASDVGFRIRVRVTATNADGSGSAASNPTDMVTAATSAPANTAEPKISGTPVQGQTLTATTGAWTNNPTSYAFQWLHCPQTGGKSDGSDCPPIAGATASTLGLQASDVGFRIRVRVTATNSGGSGSAASNPTATVTAPGVPTSITPPTVSGSPALGQTLFAAPGTWTGAQPITFAYQWLRCNSSGASCASIGGATTNSHVVVTADVGATLRIQVTAKGPAGSMQATSVQTAIVGGTPLPAGCPSGSGPVAVAALAAPARLQLDGQQVSPRTISPQTGALILRYHVSACNGRPVTGALVYATALPYNQLATMEVATGADGWATLQVRMLSGFPASAHQRLLAIFARARKPAGSLLGGISTRRLFSIHVQH